jgi:hypothetical protein
MITVADAQTLICSTAGTAASVILDRYMELGRAAAEADTGHGTAYFEYSAPDGWDPDDEDSYFGFMPALCPDPPCRCGDGKWRHTITLDAIRSERASMEPAEFARAYGNIPDLSGQKMDRVDLSNWFRPVADGGCTDPASAVTGRVALAVAVAPDAMSSAITVAGRRPDGLAHGEMTEPLRPGTAGLVARLLELAEQWDPCVLVLNAAGEALALQRELEEHGFAVKPGPRERRLMVLGAREYAQACGALAQDVANARWRHLGQKPLDDAVEGARTKPLADAWAWSWQHSEANIAPLEAVTLARHGHATFGVQTLPEPDVF